MTACQERDNPSRGGPLSGQPWSLLSMKRQGHSPRAAVYAFRLTTWAYFGLSVSACFLIRCLGDRWWPATLLLLGPRWIFVVPCLLLVPAAALWNRRSLPLLGVTFFVVVGPLMGFCVSMRGLLGGHPDGFALRIVSCNAHGSAMIPAAMSALLASTHPDLVTIQEWPSDALPPLITNPSWHIVSDGELHVESRYPIRQVASIFTNGGSLGGGAAARFVIASPIGSIVLINLHLLTPHTALREVVHFASSGPTLIDETNQARQREAALLEVAAKESGARVILAGDFNMPVDGGVYNRDFNCFTDAFSAAGLGFGWTYRARGTLVRIDHILTGADWCCQSCRVESTVGSPHLPLIAELQLRR